jgi:hypothetical protein
VPNAGLGSGADAQVGPDLGRFAPKSNLAAPRPRGATVVSRQRLFLAHSGHCIGRTVDGQCLDNLPQRFLGQSHSKQQIGLVFPSGSYGTACHCGLSQTVDVFHLARVTHISMVRTLGQFVPEVRQCDIWAVLLNQPVDPILPKAATLGAAEAKHVQLLGSLAQRVRTVWHRHNQLSRRSARSICAVALSTSAFLPVVAAINTSSAA